MQIDCITHIIDKYDVWLIDVVGIVHNGIQAYAESVHTINSLKQDYNKKIIFVSNSAKLSNRSYKKLISMGIDKDVQVFTSGEANKYTLEKCYKNKLVYHLGDDCNPEISQDLAQYFTKNISEAEAILLTAFLDSPENISQYQQELDYIIKNKLKVICANPDMQASYGHSIRLCAGYIANILIKQGVEVVYIGKPNKFIYELVTQKYKIYDKNKMLMIGDTLETDIKGAINFGIDSLLVLTGNTMRDMQKSQMIPEDFLTKYSYAPTYYMYKLTM